MLPLFRTNKQTIGAKISDKKFVFETAPLFDFTDSKYLPISRYETILIFEGLFIMSKEELLAPEPPRAASHTSGLRKNGKNCHAPKKAFRPNTGQTSYAKRKQLDVDRRATKAREQEMKEEKEEERSRRVQNIKDRRQAKEEKERYEKMAEKIHQKLVDRRKRRDKRNKLLKS